MWVAAFIALLTIGPANSDLCTENSDVVNSVSSLDKNTEVGGHLWYHVYAPITTVAGKSMFKTFLEFKTIWKDWTAVDGNIQRKADCASNTIVGTRTSDCFDLDPATVLFFNVCKPVNKTLCKLSKNYRIKSVRFVYKRVAINGSHQWILLTAFPYKKSGC